METRSRYYLAIGNNNQAKRMPGIYETEDSAIMAAKRETEKLSPADERFVRVIEDTPMGLVIYATKAQQQVRLAADRLYESAWWANRHAFDANLD